MAHRADTANARRDLRHFKIQAPFAEFFKPAKLVDVHVGMVNSIIVFHVYRHFGMTFNASDRFDGNFLCCHKLILIHHSAFTSNANVTTHLSIPACVLVPVLKAHKRSHRGQAGSQGRCNQRALLHE